MHRAMLVSLALRIAGVKERPTSYMTSSMSRSRLAKLYSRVMRVIAFAQRNLKFPQTNSWQFSGEEYAGVKSISTLLLAK